MKFFLLFSSFETQVSPCLNSLVVSWTVNAQKIAFYIYRYISNAHKETREKLEDRIAFLLFWKKKMMNKARPRYECLELIPILLLNGGYFEDHD